MKVLVRHVFRVQAYPPLTHSTGMCEILFVTRNATGMFICQDVSLKKNEHQKYHASKCTKEVVVFRLTQFNTSCFCNYRISAEIILF